MEISLQSRITKLWNVNKTAVHILVPNKLHTYSSITVWSKENTVIALVNCNEMLESWWTGVQDKGKRYNYNRILYWKDWH